MIQGFVRFGRVIVIDLEGTDLVGLLLSLIDKLISSCFVELAVSGEHASLKTL